VLPFYNADYSHYTIEQKLHLKILVITLFPNLDRHQIHHKHEGNRILEIKERQKKFTPKTEQFTNSITIYGGA